MRRKFYTFVFWGEQFSNDGSAKCWSTTRCSINRINQFMFFQWWAVFYTAHRNISVQGNFKKTETLSSTWWLGNCSIWRGTVWTNSLYRYISNMFFWASQSWKKVKGLCRRRARLFNLKQIFLLFWSLFSIRILEIGLHLPRLKQRSLSLPQSLHFSVFLRFCCTFLDAFIGPLI